MADGRDEIGNLAAQTGRLTIENEGAPDHSHRPKKPLRAYHTHQAPDSASLTPRNKQTSSEHELGERVDGDGWRQRQASYINRAEPPASSSRVNSNAIPSLPEALDDDQATYQSETYLTMERYHPPLATTVYTAVDQGNSSPKFLRLSLYSVPATAELLKKSHLTLTLAAQPLAEQNAQELPIPVVDFGIEGPPRCHRCMAYVNPFMIFTEGGSMMVCNLCMASTPVPTNYFCPLGQDSRRLDWDSRPELQLGSIDILASQAFWAREPTPIHWIFAIDVSEDSIKKNIPAAAIEGISASFYGPNASFPLGLKISIVAFDKSVYYFDMSPTKQIPELLVITDIEDCFVPLGDGIFVDPIEAQNQVEYVLRYIEQWSLKTRIPEPALGATMTSLMSALEKTGGRVSVFLSVLPTWGPGSLHFRDDIHPSRSDDETSLYQPETPYYLNMGERYTQMGIGMDLFVFGTGYVDIASVGLVPAMTGGQTIFYSNFLYARDAVRLIGDFARTLSRPNGYQGLFKVRCSEGLRVASYLGNFHQLNPSEVELASIDADKTVTAVFEHVGALDPKLDAHFQSALLYTTADGTRRIRVQNLVCGVTQSLSDVVRMCDLHSQIATTAKEAARMMLEKPVSVVREFIMEKTVSALSSYRHHLASITPPEQLLLPESLKFLPLLTLCLLKTRSFKAGSVPSDQRMYHMRLMKSMALSNIINYLYPSIYAIHSLTPDTAVLDENGQIKLPLSLRATYKNFEDGGAYLIVNSQAMYLWIHHLANPLLIRHLFGESFDCLDQLDPYMSTVPVTGTKINEQLRNLIAYFRQKHPSRTLEVQLGRQGMDGAEHEVAALLVEDMNNDTRSMVDFLVYLHKQIMSDVG